MVSAWIWRVSRLYLDVLGCAFAYAIAVAISVQWVDSSAMLSIRSGRPLHVGLYCLLAMFVFWRFRTYRTIWRYTNFEDFLRLIGTITITCAGFWLLEALLIKSDWGNKDGLRSLILLWGSTSALLLTPRLVARGVFENRTIGINRSRLTIGNAKPILLLGDTEKIDAFIRESLRKSKSHNEIVGVFSDDPYLHGRYLHGVEVIGRIDDMAAALSKLKAQGIVPKMLVLARDQPTRQEYERLVNIASGFNLTVGQLPAFGAVQDGHPVRPVAISDLLGRPEIALSDNMAVNAMVAGKKILITGAGGSIGSELARQCAGLYPGQMLLTDANEFNLYSIEMECSQNFPGLAYATALMDVRDAALVLEQLRRFQPDVVFHAAALKHVPLLESQPLEAVKTNILGTLNVADACAACGVPLMCTISTDKAVNPSSIMGATKRMAESLCQAIDQSSTSSSATRYVTVRFGNVLGSAGSVVPLFQRLINEGGPVTVTHPEITRYFMTIPEAVSLVLQASARGVGTDDVRGCIYVLDMGEPIKILDLARQMIRLSGQRPDIDIEIKIIGLRPGEKLYEEVVHADEDLSPTSTKSIFKVSPRTTDLQILRQQVLEMRAACASLDSQRVLRLLEISVPEFGRAVTTQKENNGLRHTS